MWTELGPGHEFDLIRRMLRRWGEASNSTGDDAALLDVPLGHRLVVSTDTSQEDVHFRRDWLSLEEIGYRCTTGAMSDLAAMAATPAGLLVAATIPLDVAAEIESLADGIGAAARVARCPIVGGDLNRGDRISLTTTVLGSVVEPVRRRGARAGDAIYVTGRLGGPGAAVKAWSAGKQPEPTHRARFAHPVARLDEARWLAERGVTALIDISDALASEARHLAAASGVRLRIELDLIPRVPGVSAPDAAISGEEYELLLAAPDELDSVSFAARFDIPLSRIGRVEAAGQPSVAFFHGGSRVDLHGGYDHFSA
ncbi:MAG TPA: thiamine-phosphate kinase [Gemmatimonadaceae bacterium]